MLKQKLSLLIMGLLTCGASIGATEPVQRFYLDYFFITPIRPKASQQSRIFAKISSNGSVYWKLVNFYVYNSKHKTGTMIKNLRPHDETGIIENYHTGAQFVKGEQNQIKIFFNDSDNTRTQHFFYLDFDETDTTVHVDRLDSLVYQQTNVQGYTKERGYFTATNRYTFNNWYALNDIQIYNKFDIGMFTYQETIDTLPIPIVNPELGIVFPIDYGIFCDLTEDEITLERVSMDLQLVETDNRTYQLAFQQKLYVNPYTYEMARSQLPGFVETKYIYLPKTGFTTNKELNVRIVGMKIGTMNLDLNYDFSIVAERSRIGNCVTSEYCVKTQDARFSENGKELNND